MGRILAALTPAGLPSCYGESTKRTEQPWYQSPEPPNVARVWINSDHTRPTLPQPLSRHGHGSLRFLSEHTEVFALSFRHGP